MNKGIMQGKNFYCDHLGASDNDEHDIPLFSVSRLGAGGLENYIRYRAFPDEDASYMRTYIIRDIDTDELAAYFSLKAGLISIDEYEDSGKTEFDTVPGVEVANFAVNSTYRKNHPEISGLGIMIFSYFIQPIIKHVSEQIGVKLIYIFALPRKSLIERYKDYGFRRLAKDEEDMLHHRLKPSYDRTCIFMYRNV